MKKIIVLMIVVCGMMLGQKPNSAGQFLSLKDSSGVIGPPDGKLLNGRYVSGSLPLITDLTTTGGTRRDVKSATAKTVQKIITKASIADNTLTPIFTITTTDETGSNDGGVYSVTVVGTISHFASATAGEDAVRSVYYSWGRAMKAAAAGTNGAVSAVYETASAATTSATRDIGTITITNSETSEFVVQCNATIDLTGSSVQSAEVLWTVTVTYYGFTTEPVITQL